MGIENITAAFLNQILGNYIQQIDVSQLKLGIWNGEVTLKNVLLKHSILENLGMPFKVIVGTLGALTIKIPWKRLFTNPVEIKIDGVYLLLSPCRSFGHNEDAEEKYLQTAKKNKIEYFEKTKRLITEGPMEEHKYTLEKFLSQFIKKLQISIESIHIRYEDEITYPKNPFSFGIFLNTLNIETNNQDWDPTTTSETNNRPIVHKIMKLQGLALYWNHNSDLLNKEKCMQDILATMKDMVDKNTVHVSYMLGPVDCEINVQYTGRLSIPLSNPKLIIAIEINDLLLGITNTQLHGMTKFVEWLHFTTRSQVYRKYRPAIISYSGNYKTWWKFAYRCIIEEVVWRRRSSWSWWHMKRHRELCRVYTNAYFLKLTTGKLKHEDLFRISHCERELDACNIILVREKVELIVKNSEKINEKPQTKQFSSWNDRFYYLGKYRKIETTPSFLHCLTVGDLTQVEKSKLCTAIHNFDKMLPVNSTIDVNCYLNLLLQKLRLVIKESATSSTSERAILQLNILNLETRLSSRPVSKKMKVEIAIENIEALGLKTASDIQSPHLIISSSEKSDSYVFKFSYENKPMDLHESHTLTKANVSARDLGIIYHENTITHLLKWFSTAINQPKTFQFANNFVLKLLKNYAAFESNSEAEIDVKILAPFILVPQNGQLNPKGSVLIIRLGEMLVKRKARFSITKHPRKLRDCEFKFLNVINHQFYDDFIFTAQHLLVYLAMPGEKISTVLKESHNDVAEHLIKVFNLTVNFGRCLVKRDPRLPQLKIEGHIPLLDCNITERRVIELVKLFTTLRFPDLHTILSTVDTNPGFYLKCHSTPVSKTKNENSILDFLEMLLLFKIKSILVSVARTNEEELDTSFVLCEIHQLTASLANCTTTPLLNVAVGGVTVYSVDDSTLSTIVPLYVLKTTMPNDSGIQFLHIQMYSKFLPCSEDNNCGLIKRFLNFRISSLDLIVHQDILTNFLRLFENIYSLVAELGATNNLKNQEIKSFTNSGVEEVESLNNIIRDYTIDAKLDHLNVQLSTETKNITRATLRKINFCVKQYNMKDTEIKLDLAELTLLYLEPTATYKKIVTTKDDKVFSLYVRKYKNETKDDDFLGTFKHNIKVCAATGALIVYYNVDFLEDVLRFIEGVKHKKLLIDSLIFTSDLVKRIILSCENRKTLNLDLRVSTIIIPQPTKINAAIQLDLGSLKIVNSFKNLTNENNSGSGIVDTLIVYLRDITISRINISLETLELISEVLLLEPLNIFIQAQRNLSPEMCKHIPSFKIHGHLNQVLIQCSTEDFQFIITLVNELTTGKPKVFPARRAQNLPRRKSNTEVEASYIVNIQNTDDDVADNGNNPSINTSICVDIDIILEKVILILYQGTSDLEPNWGMVQRNPKTAFTELSVVNIFSSFKNYHNFGNLYFLTVGDIILKDIRPGGNRVSNLIQRKLEDSIGPSSYGPNFITCGCQQYRKQGFLMNINTTSFTIVICTEYLLQLYGFLKLNILEVALSEYDSQTKNANDSALVKETNDDEITPFSTFCNFAKIEIILVESMESSYPNAFLFYFETNLERKNVTSSEYNVGHINNIGLSICNYSSENGCRVLAEVISPFSLTLTMNRSPKIRANIDAMISDIFIWLSPGVLDLLLKMSKGFRTKANQMDGLQSDDLSQLWEVKSNEEMNLWFLKPGTTDVGEETLEVREDTDVSVPRANDIMKNLEMQENISMKTGQILLNFETGFDSNVPVKIRIDTRLQLHAYDWSSEFHLVGSLPLEASYYNPTYGLWEYVIEPIAAQSHETKYHRLWELSFECIRANKSAQHSHLFLTEELHATKKSFVSIDIESKDILEITLTKTGLQVISTLAKEFHDVAKKRRLPQMVVTTAEYTVVNDTGTDICIMLNRSPFSPSDKTGNNDRVLLKPVTSIGLDLKHSHCDKDHRIEEYRRETERVLDIEIPEFNLRRKVSVGGAERYYILNKSTNVGLHYGLLVTTTMQNCSKIFTFRSILQIINELDTAVDVYCKDSASKLLKVGTVEAEKTLNIPFFGVYSRTSELFFAPNGHRISDTPFIWTTLLTESQTNSYISCKPGEGSNSSFNLQVVGEVRQVLHENTAKGSWTSQSCNIYLRPHFKINNLLPYPIGCYADYIQLIKFAEAGATLQMCNIKANKHKHYKFTLTIPSYQGQSWCSNIVIGNTTTVVSQWIFKSKEIKLNSITLEIRKEITPQSITVFLYCPFWMINQTGLNLCYTTAEKDAPKITHQNDFSTPVMFTFHGTAFQATKKARVKVEDSEWSKKLSLNSAGCNRSLTCKSNTMTYEIGVEIQTRSWGLTQSVIFSPRYYLINQCSFDVIVMETVLPELPILIEAGTCVGFWPRAPKSLLIATAPGTTAPGTTAEESKPFTYDSANHHLLKMKNKYGGIQIDVRVAEGKTDVTIREVMVENIPLLIVNATDKVFIEVAEKGVSESRIISPGYSQYFTWDNHNICDRVLNWWPISLKNTTPFTNNLQEDDCGNFPYYDENSKKFETYYWASFVNEIQRVMLYTSNLELVTYLQGGSYNRQIVTECNMTLHGIGLSLVDDENHHEIIYLRIESTFNPEIAWESQTEGTLKRFQPLPAEISYTIEVAYQNFLKQIESSSPTTSHVTLENGIEVNFMENKMCKPFARLIKRSIENGIWIQYKKSYHTAQWHAKIHRLQIDNQMSHCTFPVALSPISSVDGVALGKNLSNPFAEISVLKLLTTDSGSCRYKYFKILVQDVHARLDYSFISSILQLLSPSDGNVMLKTSIKKLRKEFGAACLTVKEWNALQIKLKDQNNFYDLLYLSPLQVHFSFSMFGAEKSNSSILNLMATLGLTLTEVQDVVFKISCLQLDRSYISTGQLSNQLYSHYLWEILLQLYVIVLGLDSIGNPFGLAMGVKNGVETFFFETYQGVTQGQGEFVNRLVLGVTQLLGNTVGGTFGALSKITGTWGKGIAALTLDDQYLKKRQENFVRRSPVAKEVLKRSGKGFIMGLVEGVNGVVTQPVIGAREDGINGFVKGLGRGAIGVLAKPIGGLVDFASGSCAVVERVTSTCEEDVLSIRAIRFVPTDSVLQPYAFEIQGNKISN